MKKIWIRTAIPYPVQLAASLVFILLAVTAWMIATTVRSPVHEIKKTDFETQILNRLNNKADKETLTKYYTYRAETDSYLLRTSLTNPEKITIREIIALSGFLYKDGPPNPFFSPNVLPHPLDILKSFPRLITGTSEQEQGFQWQKSLFYAIWTSLRRELIAFIAVILIAIPLGVLMSCSPYARNFVYPALTIGSFIPIAALIPLTLAFFGIGEEQKIIFLSLGMFFVLLGLVVKEIDEVDDILLNTAYTLGFKQWQTILFVLLPTALPRIWKHFAAVFGLGWGYIIFAEMINTGGSDAINGIGWLFIARQRRFKVDEMYAIFFVIIIFAFIFSYLFKLGSYLIFRHERDR